MKALTRNGKRADTGILSTFTKSAFWENGYSKATSYHGLDCFGFVQLNRHSWGNTLFEEKTVDELPCVLTAAVKNEPFGRYITDIQTGLLGDWVTCRNDSDKGLIEKPNLVHRGCAKRKHHERQIECPGPHLSCYVLNSPTADVQFDARISVRI